VSKHDEIPALDVLWRDVEIWPEPWCAKALGWSQEQVRWARRKHGLPAIKKGAHYYYRRSSVIEWFAMDERQA